MNKNTLFLTKSNIVFNNLYPTGCDIKLLHPKSFINWAKYSDFKRAIYIDCVPSNYDLRNCLAQIEATNPPKHFLTIENLINSLINKEDSLTLIMSYINNTTVIQEMAKLEILSEADKIKLINNDLDLCSFFYEKNKKSICYIVEYREWYRYTKAQGWDKISSKEIYKVLVNFIKEHIDYNDYFKGLVYANKVISIMKVLQNYFAVSLNSFITCKSVKFLDKVLVKNSTRKVEQGEYHLSTSTKSMLDLSKKEIKDFERIFLNMNLLDYLAFRNLIEALLLRETPKIYVVNACNSLVYCNLNEIFKILVRQAGDYTTYLEEKNDRAVLGNFRNLFLKRFIYMNDLTKNNLVDYVKQIVPNLLGIEPVYFNRNNALYLNCNILLLSSSNINIDHINSTLNLSSEYIEIIQLNDIIDVEQVKNKENLLGYLVNKNYL